MANENDRSEDIKKNGEINPSNTKKEKKKMGEDCSSSCFDWTYEWWCLCGNKIRCIISACWS